MRASREGSVLNPSRVAMRWFFCLDRSSSSNSWFADSDLNVHVVVKLPTTIVLPMIFMLGWCLIGVWIGGKLSYVMLW